jgi:hypothetical protein
LSFFLVVSVVVKGEKSSKRKKLAKFLTSFRLAKPLLRLAKEEDGSTNIFFAPSSLSLSLSQKNLRPTTGRDRERERESKRCAFFFSRGYFWSFFFFFFSRERYKILKYEYCKTHTIDKKLDYYLGIILMIIHAHLTRLSVCSSCIREMKHNYFPSCERISSSFSRSSHRELSHVAKLQSDPNEKKTF